MAGTVTKSYNKDDPAKNYCLNHSTPLHPVQEKLMEETLKLPLGKMLGAPEVLSLNSLIIRTTGAKKVLDIGVFTGASALAAALAMPEDGHVLACDVSEEFTNKAKKYWKEANVDHKIKLVLAPAAETLQAALDNDEAETFDFAFIDADKGNYEIYYELTLKLLRKGGTIAFDNTLTGGRVLDDSDEQPNTVSFRSLNGKLAKDDRVYTVMMNIGDGLTLVTKL